MQWWNVRSRAGFVSGTNERAQERPLHPKRGLGQPVRHFHLHALDLAVLKLHFREGLPRDC